MLENSNTQGWIKAYRSVLSNHIWLHDPTAWRVFEALMFLCDRTTGVWEGGRNQLGAVCRVTPITTYKALKRLEKAKMVTLDSNNKYTRIYLCNWNEYQGNDNNDRNNKVTTKEQQRNNGVTLLQEVRSKNREESTTPVKKRAVEPSPIFEIVEHVRSIQNLKPWVNKPKQFQAAKKILASNYFVEEANAAADRMWADVYWQDKGFDVGNLAGQIHRYNKQETSNYKKIITIEEEE